MTKAPPCLHCQQRVSLVDGSKIYTHRLDLRSKWFWLCECGAYCGCHPGSTQPLGFPANAETRKARSKLHELRLDPLWKSAPKHKRKNQRSEVYIFMASKMGLSRDNAHTGMFTIEQCREAWKVLGDYSLARESKA
jgi:zinc-finger-containing domain